METAVLGSHVLWLAPSRNPCLINTTQRIPGHRYVATGNAFSEVILDLKDIKTQYKGQQQDISHYPRRL